MKVFNSGLLLLLIFVLMPSCIDRIVIKSEVCFTVYHHERIIPDTKIYVKYNADRFPGYDDKTAYDTFFNTDENGRLCIENIQTGIHWFASFGYDDLFMEEVFGSRRINVDWPGYQVDTIIYVSE